MPEKTAVNALKQNAAPPMAPADSPLPRIWVVGGGSVLDRMKGERVSICDGVNYAADVR